jgi:hypothetical protein
MKVTFLSIAETEFVEAINYYNERSQGLGYEFAAEVKAVIQRIVQYPEAWPVVTKETRKCRCKRFPYSIVYLLKNDKIVIIAVMHLHRKPGYWVDRI